jgi:hypothetical protein
MTTFFYIAAAVLLIAALLIGRRGPRNSLRANVISAPVQVGDHNVQTNTIRSAPPPDPPKPDRVAWLIGLAGVALAAATFFLEHVMRK